MPRVLFIAFDFPPCPNAGGAVRSEKFVKYLPSLGWDVDVVAYKYEGLKTDEKYPNVNRVSSLTPWTKPYELRPYGWLLPLRATVRRILTEKKIDLIYVSCPPFPQASFLKAICEKAKVPLVVDFRDAWSLDPYVEGSRIKKILTKIVFPSVEKNLLEAVEAFIVNTESAQKAYLAKYPWLASKIQTIPNGYDEEDFNGVASSVKNRDFMEFLYCGRFGIGGRSPELLLSAYKRMLKDGSRVRFRVVGDRSDGLLALIKKLHLKDNISLTGQIAHRDAIAAMVDADVLLLYQEKTLAPISPIAGKTFEYIRAGKPVIGVVPPGDNYDLVAGNAVRFELITSYDVDDVYAAMSKLYKEWVKNRLANCATVNKEYTQSYSRYELTTKLVSVFNSCRGSNR